MKQAFKTLYFDIDGTLLNTESEPKPALANGILERTVRQAGFHRLVCVSNAIEIIHFLEREKQSPDGLGMIFNICRGTFQDESWFRQVTTLIHRPSLRAHSINFSDDWWYVDDMARDFLEQEGHAALFHSELGKRVLAPQPDGDGADIVNWLRSTERSI